MISVLVMVVEMMGGMSEEAVDEVYNSLISGNKKVEATEGIPAGGGASTSLCRPGKTSKPCYYCGKPGRFETVPEEEE